MDPRLCGAVVSASLSTSVSESEDKFIIDDSDFEASSMTGTPDSGLECSKNWWLQYSWPSFLTRVLCPFACLNVKSVAGACNESTLSFQSVLY